MKAHLGGFQMFITTNLVNHTFLCLHSRVPWGKYQEMEYPGHIPVSFSPLRATLKLSSKTDYQNAVIVPTYASPISSNPQKQTNKKAWYYWTYQSQDLPWYFIFTTKKVLHIYWIDLYPPSWVRSSYQNKRKKKCAKFLLGCLLFNKLSCVSSLHSIKEGYVSPLRWHLMNTIPPSLLYFSFSM